MASDEQEQEEVVPPKSSKLPLIIASVVCLLLGAGGGYGAATALGSGEAEAAAAAAAAAPPDDANGDGQPDEETTIADLGEFTVNLRNTAGGRVLQMKISLEVALSGAEAVTLHQSQLRDAVLMLASDYTVPELDGMDNRMAFRDEVHTRLNGVLQSKAIQRVYFTDFIVQ